MLGSLVEADDAVQEAWVRLCGSDAAAIENLGRWLTTVVARICLNMLASHKSRREEPLDLHLPDPAVSCSETLDCARLFQRSSVDGDGRDPLTLLGLRQLGS
jgi:RNA polymerase sigma-70 factor (ECF subfamily)